MALRRRKFSHLIVTCGDEDVLLDIKDVDFSIYLGYIREVAMVEKADYELLDHEGISDQTKALVMARENLFRRLVTGIRKGDIEIDVNDEARKENPDLPEEWKPICSDPDDPDFMEDWKEQIVKNFPRIVTGLAVFLDDEFQMARIKKGDPDFFPKSEQSTTPDKDPSDPA
jgi:hypothetical protein